ncbi:MAG: protein kinase [Myxococcota bacterium]|jgi:serine/threonine protein kinase|nr:protein kinase [Myxococcota bacterium]
MPVLERGALLAARYLVQSRLGSGGMASVYECFDQHSGYPVAIKLLHDHLLADNPEIVQRFRQEAQLMLRLSHPAPHPNIAAVYDVIADSRCLAIVMELITGGGLDEALARNAQLDEGIATHLCVGILNGLQHIHAHDIVHRDLKLSNILLSIDQHNNITPKIADFGIAKGRWKDADPQLAAKLTQTQSMFGSPAYMAPELFDSAMAASPRSDIYAVGIMLYELLIGEVPFVVDSMPSHVMRVSTQPAPSPRLRRPELSGDIERVLAKALAKDPAERYQNAEDFAAALEGRLDLVSAEFAVSSDVDPSKIGSDYDVEQRIGRGPTCNVYRCVDPALGVRFAAKLLRSAETEKRQRLIEQARAQASLHQGRAHPGLVAIRHVLSDEQQCALVTEYVDGLTLDRYLNETKPEMDTISRLFHEAADALAFAHSQGVLHRNLRPSNVLIAWSSSDSALRKPAKLKLSDFGMDAISGLSPLELAERTQSVPFLAPELRYDAKHSTASDVYALCALWLFALLGNLPPEAQAPGRMQAAIPAIEERLRRLLSAGLDAKPTHRPSAQDLASALKPQSASKSSLPALPQATQPSNRFAWLIAIVVALLAIGAGAFVLLDDSKATSSTQQQPTPKLEATAPQNPDQSSSQIPDQSPDLEPAYAADLAAAEKDVRDSVDAFFAEKEDLAINCLMKCAPKRKKGQAIKKGFKFVEALIKVDAEGNVTDVEIVRDDLAVIELGDCVREEILTWKLPSPGSPRQWSKEWKIQLSQAVK